MPHPDLDAHVRLDTHPDHPSAVTATLTGSAAHIARALLTLHGFEPAGEQRMTLARIDREEPYYADKAAHALRIDGCTVEITAGLREAIDTEWSWANYPMHWLNRDEIREVSNEAQQIHDDIRHGRLVIHLHAHDGWTTVAVGTYRDGKSVHLHGENHLRQAALDFDSAAEAITAFEHLHGDAVRPGPAPATRTEQQAAQALTTPSTTAPDPASAAPAPTIQRVPVYAADPGDHEALLNTFIEDQPEWEKYRTWDDDITVANHESLTLRAEFQHDTGLRDIKWTIATYASPAGERLWHATATASTPSQLVSALLDTLAADRARGAELSDTISEQTITQATRPLAEAGWKQTLDGRRIRWNPPNAPATGVQFDALAAHAHNGALPTWTIWGDNTIDHPGWALHFSPHTPAFLLQALAVELSEGQGLRQVPATSPQRSTQLTPKAPAPAPVAQAPSNISTRTR